MLASLLSIITKVLSVVCIMALLQACGGDDEATDSNSKPDSYTVTTSAGTGGSISPTSMAVNEGATASFTVTPNVGYVIDAVSGCNGSLTGNIFTTGAITTDCTVSAGFVLLPTYTVSTNAGPNGTIAPTSADMIEGETTSFTIIPDDGYGISGASGCSGSLSDNTYTTGPITSNCTVTVTFMPAYSVTTSAGVGGSISPDTTTVNEGASTSFEVSPVAGFIIDSVSGCNGVLSGNTYTTGAIIADCIVTVSFIAAYTVNTNAGPNGSISPVSKIVIHGNSTDFTVTPDAGYGIESMSGCGGTLSDNTYTTAAIVADCTVVANFIAAYTVSTTTTGGGTTGSGNISPDSATVNEGANTFFTITPNTGSAIYHVSGCAGTLSENIYTTGPINADCTVSAIFRPTFTVNTITYGNGSISPASAAVILGTNSSFTLIPDEGYGINTASGCGGTLEGNTFTTGTVFADCTVSATFSLLLPPVTEFYENNGANWNDYIKNDGVDPLSATNTPADGTETGGYSAVLHGGEMRSVEVPGKSDCAGLSARDELQAFDWLCSDTTNPVRMVSTGLRGDKFQWYFTRHLSDLIDFDLAAWKENRVTVGFNGTVYGQSPWTAWWNNPIVVDNDGSDGSDMAEGDVRIVTANTIATYIIGQNKVALLIAPNVTINGPQYVIESTVYALDRRFLWIEGTLNPAPINVGVYLRGVNLSVLRNIKIFNGSYGIRLIGAANNKITSITSAKNGVGIDVSGSPTVGLSSQNHIENVMVSNNGTGVRVYASTNNTITGVTASSNYTGMLIWGDPNFGSSTNNLVANITAANNINGIHVYASNDNTISGIIATNNQNGVYLDGNATAGQASNNTFSGVAAANNDYGIYLNSTVNNFFTDQLKVGNNSSGDCYVLVDAANGGIDPGLDDDTAAGFDDLVHDGLCLAQGSSDFVLTEGITLANSFVGKYQTDNANQSDIEAMADYPVDTGSFDWIHFDNPWRGWGIDGSTFPASDHRGEWGTGLGRIWDWRLNQYVSPVLRARPVPTGNDTMTHTWSDGSVSTFLRNAMEIQSDGVGNDNGLCETNETCLYTPNMGSFQGYGVFTNIDTFIDGTLTGIRLLRYEFNGR